MRKKESSVRLKEIREFFGLNQKAFAKILDMKQNYLSRYETGEHEFTDDLKLKLVNMITQKYKKRINLDWFVSGNGTMFLENLGESSVVLKKPSLGALIDQRLEEIEAKIAKMENYIKAGQPKDPNPGLYVLEPEPEYDTQVNAPFVENIAAGPPIYQADDQAVIKVPKHLIKTDPGDYYVGRIKGTSMVKAGIPDGGLALFRISDTPRDGAIQLVERQGEATVKRMREIPGKGWEICFEDGSGEVIPVGPGDEFHIQGDFVAILPDYLEKTIRPTGEPQGAAGK
jgi:SOS-response transcriptional repressor LexA